MYLWPPRPERKIPPETLPMVKQIGWVAECKKNGSCSVLSYDPTTGELEAWNRHNARHTTWRPDLNSPCLRKLRELKGGLYILVGELLHTKVPGIKDTMYLFDILMADGKSLVGQTYQARYKLLHSLWHETAGNHYNLADERLWVANILTGDLQTIFKGLTAPEDEGLVLKDPQARLEPCVRQSSNSKGQIKCRKSTKNYGF